MNLEELKIEQEIYIARPYEIKFRYGYPQYLGVARGKNIIISYHVKKVNDEEFVVLEEGMEDIYISKESIEKEFIFETSKEKLIDRWVKDYEQNMQALKDFVNNVPDEDTGFEQGIDTHDEWIKSSELIKKG
jgi:hypothetical protein